MSVSGSSKFLVWANSCLNAFFLFSVSFWPQKLSHNAIYPGLFLLGWPCALSNPLSPIYVSEIAGSGNTGMGTSVFNFKYWCSFLQTFWDIWQGNNLILIPSFRGSFNMVFLFFNYDASTFTNHLCNVIL